MKNMRKSFIEFGFPFSTSEEKDDMIGLGLTYIPNCEDEYGGIFDEYCLSLFLINIYFVIWK